MKRWRCHLLICLFYFRLLVGQFQEEETNREEDGQGSDGDVEGPSHQLDGGDDSGTQEGSPLGEDVIDAEVLAGVLSRNDLGLV